MVSWNENGAGGRDRVDMLELIGDNDWFVVFEPDMGVARDRDIWSMNIIRQPQSIPEGAVNWVERAVVRKLNVSLMR